MTIEEMIKFAGVTTIHFYYNKCEVITKELDYFYGKTLKSTLTKAVKWTKQSS